MRHRNELEVDGDILHSVEDQSVSETMAGPEVQSALETAIGELGITCAPINRLPVELLQAIFKITFPTLTKAQFLKVLRATHVCRHWRTIVQSYARFWSTIFINDTSPAFVAHCLELGGQSLHVYIDVKVTTFRTKYTIKRQLRPNDVDSVNLLLKYPEHIRALDIRASFALHPKLLVPIIDVCRALFPYIYRLGWADDSGMLSIADVAIPNSLPRLRHLSLYQSPGTPVVDQVSGLKSLRWMVERISARMFVELLQRNGGLESITIRDCTCHAAPDDPLASTPQPVLLPNLKSLTISNSSATAEYLNAPLISSLPILRVCYCDEIPAQAGFWSSSPVDPSLSLRVITVSPGSLFFTRLAPFWGGVTTFGLHQSAGPPYSRWDGYPVDITDVWKLLPRLHVLEVTWSYNLDITLQPLLDSPDICPTLSRIEISPSSELMDDPGALGFFPRLLESRAACGKHLSDIVLSHKMNSDGSPRELIPFDLRDWVRGYPSFPEEPAYRPNPYHLDVFWTSLSERCRGFLRPA